MYHERFGNTDSLKIVHEKPPSDTYNPKPNSAMYKKKNRSENLSKVSFNEFMASPVVPQTHQKVHFAHEQRLNRSEERPLIDEYRHIAFSKKVT